MLVLKEQELLPFFTKVNGVWVLGRYNKKEYRYSNSSEYSPSYPAERLHVHSGGLQVQPISAPRLSLLHTDRKHQKKAKAK